MYPFRVKVEDTNQISSNHADRRVGKRQYAAFAIATFGLGIALPLLGLLLAVAHSLIEGDKALGVAGTVCLIATIPMIMLGSHLMDAFDKAD